MRHIRMTALEHENGSEPNVPAHTKLFGLQEDNFLTNYTDDERRQKLLGLLKEKNSNHNTQPKLAQSDDVAAVLEMIQRQADDISDLKRRIILLEAKQPLTLDRGRLPPLSELSKLEVQIFHRPELANVKDKRKTEWSLRLTAWIKGRRAKPDRNVALYSGAQFYSQAMTALSKLYVGNDMERSLLDHEATRIEHGDDSLGGMLRDITNGGGSPSNLAQFCVLSGHLTDSPEVLVAINGEVLVFSRFTPGKGMKATRAKWYAALTFDV